MKDGLPRRRSEDRAVSALGVAVFLGEGRGPAHHLADQGVVSRRKIVQRRDVPARHDQHVHRRLRVDVLEGDDAIVLIDNRRGNLAGDDLAEQAVRHICLHRLSGVGVRDSGFGNH